MIEKEFVRFAMKIALGDDCWPWVGAKIKGGYGRFYTGYNKTTKKRISKYAHRLSYEHFVGPIPEGLVIDHLCRNRACVNPLHLEPVTFHENIRRGMSPAERMKITAATRRAATHCRFGGHLMDDHNTVWKNNGSGTKVRVCRICRIVRQRIWTKARREAETHVENI